MVSHEDIQQLLRREANMSGYGYGMECPSCDGSGLIGGFAGQKEAYAELANRPLTVAQRKLARKAIINAFGTEADKRGPKPMTAERRLKLAQAVVAREGAPGPKRRAKAVPIGLDAIRRVLDEMKFE